MYNDPVYSHTIHKENSIYKDHIELVNHPAVDALVRTWNHLSIFLNFKKKNSLFQIA